MIDNELLLAMSDLFDSKLQPINEKLDNVQNDVIVLQTDVNNIKHDITNIQLTLENQTNRNIMQVAEGHLDLSRKLDEALKINNEKEMLIIRVNIQENEIRLIKEKLKTIA